MAKKITSYLIVLIMITSAAFAQTHQVEDVNFENNKEALEYFKKVESQHLTEYAEMVRSSWKSGQKTMRYEFQKEGKNLLVTQYKSDRSQSMELEKIESDIFQKEIGKRNLVVDLSGNVPVVYLDTYVSVEKKEGYEDDYNNFVNNYGEKVRAFRMESILSPLTEKDLADELHVERSFEVTDISVKTNDEVLSFAKKYESVGSVMNYHEMGENALENVFLGTEYSITIDGPQAKIHSKSENGSSRFTSSVNKISENRYRFVMGKLFYDFVIEEGGEELFEVTQIELGEFFQPEEEFENTFELKKLAEKFGKEIPYYTLIQKVKPADKE